MEQQRAKMPLWTIKGVVQDTKFTPTGPVPSMKVTISIVGNVDAILEIPQNEFHQDRVNELASELANRVISVLNLEGPDLNQQVDPMTYLDPSLT